MIKEIIFSVCLIFLLIVIVQAEENNNELAHQLVKKMDEALFPNN